MSYSLKIIFYLFTERIIICENPILNITKKVIDFWLKDQRLYPKEMRQGFENFLT